MTTQDSGFLRQLDHYDLIARDAALAYLASSGVCTYLGTPAADYLHRGGKGLRPALCLATCTAFGGSLDDAIPSAAAIELFHTAFLVHDDVEDDSEMRRGAPTLHRRYGLPMAVNAGDGLAVLALGALRDNERRLGRRLSARIGLEFDMMARQTVDGQARELGWQLEGRTDLNADDYLEMILQKTCWYTTLLPLRVGVLIGAKRTVDLVPMLRFGFFLGAAFQIRDDVLNLRSPDGEYGKEPWGDLREGKRTLIMLHLLAAASQSDRQRTVQFLTLERSQRSPDMIAEMLALIDSYGSVAFAEEFARGIATSATWAFDEAFAEATDGGSRRFVRELIPYMVERNR